MLLFIGYGEQELDTVIFVSIHLMLLFIRVKKDGGYEVIVFQYISCYSLSAHRTEPQASRSSFNTSHVTLYRISKEDQEWLSRVSIHLMLLFISLEAVKTATTTAFQYISCYSLSTGSGEQIPKHQCFNTSHVTLYRKRIYIFGIRLSVFQYISCYSLSKTSSWNDRECKFQYISCYSLSVDILCNCAIEGMFQYISCYSLSAYQPPISANIASFNTSHVTLYRTQTKEI